MLTKKQLLRIWKQYYDERNINIPDALFLKPKSKATRQLQLTIEMEQSIDHIVLHYNGNVSYRELKMDLINESYDLALSTVFYYCQAMAVKDRDSHIKPKLTGYNIMQRLAWVLHEIDITDLNNLKYHHQHDEASLDESWFFCQKRKKKT